jgi:16S rRNA (uracil1498-N3)-methyltransferase
MHVFYTPDLQDQAHYQLNEEESKHCSRVLRLSVGDTVFLIDGRGGLYEAEIETAAKKHVELRITKTTKAYQKRNHHLHIAVAPTKNIDRLEWFLEKATEIGIDEITPIICERSERKVVKGDRLEKVITAAVKQSLQAYHPVLNPAVTFSELLAKQTNFQQTNAQQLDLHTNAQTSVSKLIAHCIDDEQRRYLKDLVQPHGNYLMLIGPEGDFSPQEISSALAEGFMPVTLGTTRLRTETAALAACFEINYLNR